MGSEIMFPHLDYFVTKEKVEVGDIIKIYACIISTSPKTATCTPEVVSQLFRVVERVPYKEGFAYKLETINETN